MEIDLLWSLLGEYGPGALAVHTSRGMESRPIMAVIDRTENEIVTVTAEDWLDSRYGREIDVSMAFVDEFRRSCLSINGSMRQSCNRRDIAESWAGLARGIRGRSGGGAEKSGLVSLRMSPKSAELWDLQGSKPRQSWHIHAGVMTETTPHS